MGKRLKMFLLCGLLAFNALFFTAKQTQIFAGLGQRDPAIAEAFAAKHIPPGSKVVGEAMYYYAVKKAGSDFQLMDFYLSDEERELKHRQNYDYDYLIVTDHYLWRRKTLVDLYLKNSAMDSVARLETPPGAFSLFLSEFTIAGRNVLTNTEKAGYSCTIYKRRKG